MTEPTTPGAQVLAHDDIIAATMDESYPGDGYVIPFARAIERAVLAKLAAQVAAQQAVMRQALDALVLLDDAFCADDYGDREGRIRGRKALTNSRAAVASLRAALSATQEVPDEAA
jgi:hypothetical protein